MWVLAYLDDIESDFSVFHRVENLRDMPAVKFFRFALRLGAYDGALAARIHQETPDTGTRAAEPAQEVPDTELLAQHADLFTDK